jgi:hypothetical protein
MLPLPALPSCHLFLEFCPVLLHLPVGTSIPPACTCSPFHCCCFYLQSCQCRHYQESCPLLLTSFKSAVKSPCLYIQPCPFLVPSAAVVSMVPLPGFMSSPLLPLPAVLSTPPASTCNPVQATSTRRPVHLSSINSIKGPVHSPCSCLSDPLMIYLQSFPPLCRRSP